MNNRNPWVVIVAVCLASFASGCAGDMEEEALEESNAALAEPGRNMCHSDRAYGAVRTAIGADGKLHATHYAISSEAGSRGNNELTIDTRSANGRWTGKSLVSQKGDWIFDGRVGWVELPAEARAIVLDEESRFAFKFDIPWRRDESCSDRFRSVPHGR